MARLTDPATAFDAMRVICWRLPMLACAMAQPGAGSSREIARMVAEKQAALALGMIGAQEALLRAWLNGTIDHARIVADMTAAAEAPALKTLRGNARRLSRRKGQRHGA